MAACFRLHRFSQKELSNVLLCMHTIDRLSYSLCSRKCKKQTVDLNLRTTKLSVDVKNEFSIDTEFGDFSGVEVTMRGEPILNLNASKNFLVKGYEQDSFWYYDLFSAQDWLRHHLDIYHSKSINQISFEHRALGFHREQLIGMLERLEIGELDIFMSESQEHTQAILDLHLRVKQFNIFLDSFNRPELLRKILIENLGHVIINRFIEAEVPRLLDDILLANTSQLQLTFLHFSGKELNRLVKSWIRGACKRLEVLYIELKEPANEDIVLRGITHTEITRQDLLAKMDIYNYNHRENGLIGDKWFNIRGKDGREATISVYADGLRVSFHLFVWQ